MSPDIQTKEKMDRMYRWTRHFYDASRKYYLLGRDELITHLKCKNDEHVCEVGCGTARNLLLMRRDYPNTHFYGIDVSDEMLKTARGAIDQQDIKVAQGYSQSFDPKALFKLEKPLDKIVFSYALSIIPPWQESVDHALDLLPDGGEIHIVDFGNMDGQPKWFRKLIFWWLELFHVYHKPEILEYLQKLVVDGKGTLNVTQLYNGYAYMAVFRKT